jgi:hypothetical protein
MKRGTARLLYVAGVFSFLIMAALAMWPTPGKYPWVLPAAAVSISAFAWHRRRFHADQDSQYLLAILLVVVFSAMTLLHVGNDMRIPAFVVWIGIVGLATAPIAAFVVALIASGSADYPYDEEP